MRLFARNYEICREGKPDCVVVQPLPWREGDWMKLRVLLTEWCDWPKLTPFV